MTLDSLSVTPLKCLKIHYNRVQSSTMVGENFEIHLSEMTINALESSTMVGEILKFTFLT